MNRKNEFIMKQKRKKAIKKIVMLVTVVIFLFGVALFTLPIFKVDKIIIKGKAILSNEEILKNLNYIKGENIVLVDKKKINNNLKVNNYIESVVVKKKLFNSIVIEINEREVFYYVNKENSAYLLDGKGIVIDKVSVDEAIQKKYVEVKGIEDSNLEVGKLVKEDLLLEKSLEKFSEIIEKNTSNKTLKSIDFSNIIFIKGYIDNVEIKFGDSNDLEEKTNKVINILMDKKINMKKGYIDVSFNGLPIINVEK